MARPRLHDQNLRERLLAHAGRLVTETGVAGLSLRTLAAEAGTSTAAVYSLFGGKPALLGALFSECFSSFGASQRAVPITGDTIADLAALGQAYWTWAMQNPHLYGVMFGQRLVGLDLTPEQAAMADATIEPLAGVVASAVRAGVMSGDPFTITLSIWAAVHGVVALAQADRVPADRAVTATLFTATAAATARGWLSTAQDQPIR